VRREILVTLALVLATAGLVIYLARALGESVFVFV
jgi:hypothetical protein